MAGTRWIRARLQPFEAAFAVIIATQGAVALAGGAVVDPVRALLPAWLTLAFLILYTAAGATILLGLVLPRGDLEGAGLVLLGLILLARAALYGTLLGWGLTAVTSLVFSACLAGACTARLLMLAKPQWLIHPTAGDGS